jgi:hypothetical protein
MSLSRWVVVATGLATATFGLSNWANASSCYKLSQGVCKQSSFGNLDSTCTYSCSVGLKSSTMKHTKKKTHPQ